MIGGSNTKIKKSGTYPTSTKGLQRWEFIKENKRLRKKERNQESDQENDQEKEKFLD